MIPIVTPRMDAVIQQLSIEEATQIEAAVLANNDLLVLKLLAAKDSEILVELMQYIQTHSLDHKELDPDADWIMPKMYLRKHIWENFPVNVVQIDSKADGRECYSVQWHYKKFQAAREECEHGWQYMDFEDDMYRRLMKSLRSSRNWTVEEGVTSEDICILVMNVPKTSDDEQSAAPSTLVLDSDNESIGSSWNTVSTKRSNNTASTIPVLRRLNDIKNHFPVIWNEVHGCKSTTYAVEIFGKKAREQGLNVENVKVNLLEALNASRSWTVLPATSDRHVCLLQMNHLNL